MLTIAVGYTAAGVDLRSMPFSLLQWSAPVVCGFALFRAGSFVHEIAHLRRGEMTSFRVGWNLLCGIPMIMPSHFYENHIDHHNWSAVKMLTRNVTAHRPVQHHGSSCLHVGNPILEESETPTCSP